MQIFDVFLLEAVINGILLGGILALLALGLNLIFGVIDVVWICYAELMMVGMYITRARSLVKLTRASRTPSRLPNTFSKRRSPLSSPSP